ncbi:hypothetical protein [Nocardiopsis kunsanensis]|nr:hypothetical protein [Nocardiopsis kunsanensis]
MRRVTPRSLLSLLIDRALYPAGVIVQCPVCGAHYDPSDIQGSYPHNNH